MTTELATIVIERVPALEEQRDRVVATLERFLGEARESWPAWIENEPLGGHIATLVGDSSEPLEAMEALNAGDVYLAAAVTAGSAPACAALEEQIRRLAKVVVLRMGGDQDAAEETASEAIEKLMVGSRDRAARIADYKGRGSLAGWLRATLSRTYLNARRKNKREILVGDDAVLEALDDDHSDPAMLHMKSQYRREFAAAFEAAIATLSDRQRGVLRYRFVDGSPIETIAAVYRVHRATCHRWISEARAALAAQTEKRLRAQLAVSDVELDAIRALIESQLELSLSRMFAK